ncbi:MAG: hypothetical protein P4L90_13225 [Rhodopila sp.]|nr:hypothetical protein [Rhodopila sp.]
MRPQLIYFLEQNILGDAASRFSDGDEYTAPTIPAVNAVISVHRDGRSAQPHGIDVAVQVH